MLFHALVSHSVHSHPQETDVLRGCSTGAEQTCVDPCAPCSQMRFLFSFRRGPKSCHPKLQSTDVLEQRMRCVRSRVCVAKSA